MMMGIGLALATLGAILRFAVDDTWDSFDMSVVGLILILVGSVAFATGVMLEFVKRPRVAPMPPQVPVSGLPPTTPPQPYPPQSYPQQSYPPQSPPKPPAS